ncbi:type B 50S ribosomal protein L31 [Nonomuraea sp. NPDC055795]
MKKNLHPEYRPVVFRDKSLREKSADYAFLTRSTRASAQTIEWTDGRVYPVVDVDVSSASHPYYTGRGRVLDTAGRVERFRQRYGTK